MRQRPPGRVSFLQGYSRAPKVVHMGPFQISVLADEVHESVSEVGLASEVNGEVEEVVLPCKVTRVQQMKQHGPEPGGSSSSLSVPKTLHLHRWPGVVVWQVSHHDSRAWPPSCRILLCAGVPHGGYFGQLSIRGAAGRTTMMSQARWHAL